MNDCHLPRAVKVALLAIGFVPFAAAQGSDFVFGGEVTLQGEFLPELVPGDFDRDGLQDLFCVTELSDGTLRYALHLAGAPARFEAEPAFIAPAVASSGGVSAVGDVDGDGDLDGVGVVRDGPGAPQRVVLFRGDGTGALAVELGAPVSGTVETIRLADGDGDGDLDIWVFGASGDRVLRIDMQSGGPAQTTTDAGRGSEHFALADLDGDGALELIAGGTGGVTVRSGATGMEIVAWLPATPGIAVVGEIGDVTGDGILDILARHSDESVFLAGDGALGFSPASLFSAPNRELFIAFADLDGDGVRDYLVSRRGPFPATPEILWVSGAVPVPLPAPELLAAGIALEANPVRVADLDADGRDDILFSTFVGTSRVDGTNNTIAFSFPGPGVAPSSGPPALFDVDLDGDLDIVISGLGVSQLTVALNRGLGAFSPGIGLDLPLSQGGALGTVVPRDAPGELHVVGGASGTPAVLEYAATSSGLVPVAVRSLPLDALLDVVDADGDGRQDYLYVRQNAVWFAPGAPLAGSPVGELAFGSLGDVEVGDIDGDGRLDLVMGSGPRVEIRRVLADGSLAPLQEVSLASVASDLAVADFDGDNNTDVAYRVGSRLLILRGSGSGLPGPFPGILMDAPFPAPGTSGGFPFRLNTEDVDQDGAPDVVLIAENPAAGVAAAYLPGSTIRSVTPPYDVSNLVMVIGAGPLEGPIRFGDLDGDGDLDAAAAVDPVIEGQVRLALNPLTPRLDSAFCTVSSPLNSAGEIARLGAYGDDRATGGGFELIAAGLPERAFAIALGANGQSSPVALTNALTPLCLAPGFGLYSRPGEIRVAAGGTFNFGIDPGALRLATGDVAGVAGQTWYFQAWYRDRIAGQATSAFSEGSAVLLR